MTPALSPHKGGIEMLPKETTDFQAALRELENWGSAPPSAKQRRFTRFSSRGTARIFSGSSSVDRDTAVIAQVRDISRGGIGFLTTTPAAVGDYWQIQLGEGKVVVDSMPAYCRFCREVVDGAYLIGAEFGVQAGVLMAMGVTSQEIARGDDPEDEQHTSNAFVDPESLVE